MSKLAKINRIRLVKKNPSLEKGSVSKATEEPNREDVIENFLKAKGIPQTFGEINSYLKINCPYEPKNPNDRTGLSHALLRMISKNVIVKHEKNQQYKYPRYSSLSQSTFDAQLDGYLLRTESTANLFKPFGFWQINDGVNKSKLSDEEVLIKKIAPRLGVQILYMIIASSKRPITKGKSKEENQNNRKAWLNNALSLNQPIDEISEVVSNYLDGKDIQKLIQAMDKHYPAIMKQMKDAEEVIDDVELKNSFREMYLNSNDAKIRLVK